MIYSLNFRIKLFVAFKLNPGLKSFHERLIYTFENYDNFIYFNYCTVPEQVILFSERKR